MMSSYLSDRSQSVFLNGFQSGVLPVTCGLPQGSVLGPILFSAFINDLPSRLNHCMSHLFADDFQLYRAINEDNVSLDMSLLKSDLSAVSAWAKENRLKLNAGKTKAIVFSSGSWARELPEIEFEGASVNYVDSVNNLGLTLESRMGWASHASKVSAKVFAGLRNMWPSARFIPVRTRELLVKSLLMPHMTYCCPVLGELSAGTRKIFEKCFNACTRFAYGIGRYDSISDHAHRLLGKDLFAYFDYLTSSFLHKVIVTQEPDYIFQNLTFGSSNRLRNLILPRNDKNIVNDSFYVRGVSKYNSLPASVKGKLSLTGFKRACREHMGLSGH